MLEEIVKFCYVGFVYMFGWSFIMFLVCFVYCLCIEGCENVLLDGFVIFVSNYLLFIDFIVILVVVFCFVYFFVKLFYFEGMGF